MCPDINNLVIALVVGNETHIVVVHYLLNLSIALLDKLLLLGWNEHVVEVERQTALECHVVTQVLDVVKELGTARHTTVADNLCDNLLKRLLRNHLVDISEFLGNAVVEDDAAHRGVLHDVADGVAVGIHIVNHHRNDGVHCQLALVEGDSGFFGAVECEALAHSTLTKLGDVIQTKNHILRRHGDRLTVGRIEDVVRHEHQHLSLNDSLVAQWQVNCHLVAIEVGIKWSTCQWVQLDCLTLNEFWLESLDTESVQCWGTVEEYGMTLHHVL